MCLLFSVSLLAHCWFLQCLPISLLTTSSCILWQALLATLPVFFLLSFPFSWTLFHPLWQCVQLKIPLLPPCLQLGWIWHSNGWSDVKAGLVDWAWSHSFFSCLALCPPPSCLQLKPWGAKAPRGAKDSWETEGTWFPVASMSPCTTWD